MKTLSHFATVADYEEYLETEKPISLPEQFDGEFYGYNIGKVFIKTECGHTHVIDIRGWGYLTGRGGGLAMGEDEACETQDQFERWVIKALNSHRTTNPNTEDNEHKHR